MTHDLKAEMTTSLPGAFRQGHHQINLQAYIYTCTCTESEMEGWGQKGNDTIGACQTVVVVAQLWPKRKGTQTLLFFGGCLRSGKMVPASPHTQVPGEPQRTLAEGHARP